MADKVLTEKEWRGFAKSQPYKADALAKALASLEKAEKSGADAQLTALDEVASQCEALLKAHKGDKALAGYLADIDKAAKKLRKDAETAVKSKADADSGDEEDEKPNALMDPKKLLAQLNLCKKDGDRSVQFAYVDGKDKQPPVLAMSPKLAGKKMFATITEQIGVKTGAFGTAWIDGTALMLQLDKPMSGLVKKIRGPVKACGFKISKAVLWNADGTVFEQEAETDEPPPAPPLPPGKPGATANAPAPTTDAPAPAPGGETESDPSAAFNARLAALLPRLKTAAPERAQDLKLKASEAGLFARKKDFAKANALLDEAEKLLGSGIPPAPPLPPGGKEPGAAFNARLAALVPKVQAARTAGHPAAADIALKVSEAGVFARKKDFEAAGARLDEAEELLKTPAGPTPEGSGQPDEEPPINLLRFNAGWASARDAIREAGEAVDGQIGQLQARLRGDPDGELRQIAEFGLPGLTANHRVPMQAALMSIDAAVSDPIRLKGLVAKAAGLAAAYANHLRSAQTIAAVDENPFGVAVSIRQTLGGALDDLGQFFEGVRAR